MPKPIRRLAIVNYLLFRSSNAKKWPAKVPELAIHIAIKEPMNQAHTAVAGPPELSGLPIVAGTDPNTPKIEMA